MEKNEKDNNTRYAVMQRACRDEINEDHSDQGLQV